ncbi:MAG: phosphomethylpyrimidine synthase ThiC, partial [Candidatus Omnitrophica bacterium]|nr:phosphomethylpyrimidine synthase ThiC [Candidatus Omnitrophota bacterium]
MTQLEYARRGKISVEMRRVADSEGVNPELIRRGISAGRIVIPRNIRRRISSLCGIGHRLKTKVNANIGTSKGSSNIAKELAKMDAAIVCGADTIMDLSTGPKIKETRRAILSGSAVPVGTVPIYEIVINGLKKYGNIKDITAEDMFDVLQT